MNKIARGIFIFVVNCKFCFRYEFKQLFIIVSFKSSFVYIRF